MDLIDLELRETYAVSADWKIVYGLISFFSLICSLVIPLVYFQSKKTRHHPAIILVLICIFEMVSCYHLMIWAMDLRNFMEFFRVYELITIFTFGIIEDNDKQKFDDSLTYCQMNQTLYFLSLFFQFSYYIILCLDLIITLKMPFISGKQRLQWYHLGVSVNTLISFYYMWGNIQIFCDSFKNRTQPMLSIAYTPVIVIEAAFYFVGIISIMMAMKTQYKNSKINKELYQAKNQYLLNHIFLVGIIFIVWSIPFCNNLLMISSISSNNTSNLMNSISFCILLSQGMFLAIVRLNEKFFRMRMITSVRSFFRVATEAQLKAMQELEEQDNADEDDWNFSLATLVGKAQNQEVVSNILQGITQITKYQNSATLLPHNQQIFSSPEILKKWCQERKKKTFKDDDVVSSMNIISPLLDKKSELLTKKSEQFDGSDFQEMTVTEYAPKVYQIMRNQDNITPEIFQNSLSIELNSGQIKRAQQSLGKSGAFFFFSHDNKLILKTMSNKELKVLNKQFLKNYVQHLMKNPQSVIAKVYGAYTISIAGVAAINLILLENTLGSLTQSGGTIKLYDLKGSLVNRYVKDKLQPQRDKTQSNVTLPKSTSQSTSLPFDKVVPRVDLKKATVYKDLNYLQSEDLFLELPNLDRDNLLNQMKRDTDFLQENTIMDYSLLLGITETQDIQTKDVNLSPNSRRQIIDANGNMMSFALIDYLQLFDLSKRLEYSYKTIIQQNSKDLISCVFPKQYQARFLFFVNQIICSVVEEII